MGSPFASRFPWLQISGTSTGLAFCVYTHQIIPNAKLANITIIIAVFKHYIAT